MPLLVSLLPADAESDLPPCCRRGGAHHCAMMEMMRQSAGDGFHPLQARCPRWPVKAVHFASRNYLSTSSEPLYGMLPSGTEKLAQVEAAYIVSKARTHHKRGPPSFLNC
jgi:hypothetical protein